MFTEEDAQDDAKIKKETRGDLVRVAKNRSPKLFQHFENVCAQLNQDPKDVLADMLVRAINNQEYADSIANTDVTMDAVSSGTYRKDDIKLVKEIADEFGLEPDEDDSVIEKAINQRIEAVSGGPLDRFDDRKRQESDGKVSRLERKVDELQRELEQERTEESHSPEPNPDVSEETEDTQESEGERLDIDDLFDEEEEESEDVVEEEEFEDDSALDDIETVDVSVETTDDEVEEAVEEEESSDFDDEFDEEVEDDIPDREKGAGVDDPDDDDDYLDEPPEHDPEEVEEDEEDE